MRGVHHGAGLRGDGRKMVEHVEAHLPRRMKALRRAAHHHERLARRDAITVGARAHHLATELRHHPTHHLDARDHAVLAREVLHLALLVGDAEHLARQIDVGQILSDEIVDARIGKILHETVLSLRQSANARFIRSQALSSIMR